MNQLFSFLDPFPSSAKNGILALFAGWIFFLISLYTYYLPGENPSKEVLVAIALCYVVAKGFNWGRILCLLANIMLIIWCAVFAAAYFYPQFIKLYGKHTAFGASLVNLAFFSMSTYFLFKKETSEFFKTFRKKGTDGSGTG